MAAAASTAAHRLEINERRAELKYAQMTDLEKIRYKREQNRKKMRAATTEKQAQIEHEMNLNADIWPSPVKEYLLFCRHCDNFVNGSYFSNYILICIVIAGALVGVQTYEEFENDSVIAFFDVIILWSFSAEVLLKIFGEGLGPWNYFIGQQWAWNNFDFLIVIFSLPFIPFAAGQVKLLRLIRLMRLAKAFRKIPQLQMIIMGLIGGLKSIVYIVILMFLVFYLYACAGIIFFKGNDPFHFKSVEVSMLTLLGVATLDGWGEIMFVNYFGCDVYSGGFYTNDRTEHDPSTGGVYWCGTPQAQPVVSALYFISFIVLASFCILSLFIGAVAMSMVESMQDMKKTSKEVEELRILKVRGEIVSSIENRHLLGRKALRRLRLIELSFQGQDMRKIETEHLVTNENIGFIAMKYRDIAYMAEDLSEDESFQHVITGVIILAGLTVGIGTDEKLAIQFADAIGWCDIIIQYIFLTEMIIKIVACEFKPWHYVKDNWNKFDALVVIGSFLPTGNGSLITVLRLLRLLRVLKLLKALPQLQVIVSALMKGLSAIAFISIILFMFFYFFGIIAMTFFGPNDAWHFGSLHMSMLTLFQCATMDNWSSIMWISLYGCDVQDAGYPELCTDPQSQFVLATLFFLLIILVGALVLLTLFIGVVGMSMEEASQEQKKEAEIEARAFVIGEVEKLDEKQVRLFREVFDALDLIDASRVGAEEMKFGLKLAGLTLDENEFQDVWAKVDRDNSNGIDFAEFLEFMCDLKSNLSLLVGEEETSQDPLAKENIRRQFTFMKKENTTNTIKSLNDKQDEQPKPYEMFKPVTSSSVVSAIDEDNEVHPFTPLNTEKQKQFAQGKGNNNAMKKYEPGNNFMKESLQTPNKIENSSLPAISPDSDNHERGELAKKTDIPPMSRTTTSPNGERHNYTVSRAKSSFQKVPFGGTVGDEDGSNPETPIIRRPGQPIGRSPYSSPKKSVKSLIVSI